jgi:heat shock protein HtpX
VSANRRATRRLLALFTVLVLPFVAGLIPLLAPVISFGVLLPALGEAAFDRIHSTTEGTVLMFATTATLALLVALVVGIAVAWLELEQAPRLVLRLTRARPVSREDEPELWRTVENLSLAAGLPTPKAYVIESRGPNAFAVGLDPEHAAVVVTRGLLGLLDRRGLHGVIAHELSHIGNQDTRLNTVLAAVLAVLRLPLALLTRGRHPLVTKGCLVLSGLMAVMAALSVLAILAEIALALWFFSGEVRNSLAAIGRGNVILIGMMIFYGPLFMGSPFYVLFGAQLCGRRVGSAVSRQREFLADADAVLLTRDPEGLALALVKVAAASGVSMNLPRAAAHLFLVEPPLPETGWWDRGVASHPPIEERVAVLGQMGSGIPPEALEAAREAGERFCRAATDERPTRAGAPSVAALPSPARREADETALGPQRADIPARGEDRLPRGGDPYGPGVVSYVRLAQGPVPLLERPEAAARTCGRLAAGTLLALLAVEGEFLRVQTTEGATGYIGKDTPVTWGPA